MNVEPLTESASSNGFQKKVSSAWEDLMATGRCNRDLVREIIFASWQRCIDSSAAHRDARNMLMVPRDALARTQEQNHEFRHAARGVMESIQGTLGAARSVVLLTDMEGIILDAYGTRRNLDFAADINLRPGGNCNEIAGGTNAIGTALAIGEPAQVHAGEHFYEYAKGWTCSAALVRDPIDRKILGVLDISGTRETFNAHNLALAISVAGQIEGLMQVRETQNRIRLLQWCGEEASSWANDAVVVLDSKRRVVSRNKHVAGWLARRGIAEHAARALDGLAAAAPDGSYSRPDWLKDEWIHPVRIDGRELGFLVVLPQAATRPAGERSAALAASPAAPAQAAAAPQAFARLVGGSEALRSALDRARKLAAGDFPILVLGETGTGKEELAAAIHQASPMSAGPFVAINCGALPRELAASELFGYADGAYTGSRRGGRAGKFEEADGGTLLLDEVGELPPDIQVQMLRVLEDGTLCRIGENRVRRVTVRILAATHVDLRRAMEQGTFRKDLYFRLSVGTIAIPPLRQRRSDIAVLAGHFLRRLADKYGRPERSLAPGLLAALEAHDWPGNVRELKNLLEQLWHLSSGEILTTADLPSGFERCGDIGAADEPLSVLERSEREQICASLERCGNNMAKTARCLGIARSTLYLKLKKYGIALD